MGAKLPVYVVSLSLLTASLLAEEEGLAPNYS